MNEYKNTEEDCYVYKDRKEGKDWNTDTEED